MVVASPSVSCGGQLRPVARLILFLAVALGLLASAVGVWAARTGARAPAAGYDLVAGKKDYRIYCGQCHALAAALAAGFGGVNKFGQDGGPSFDNLRVSFAISVDAITESFSGHEIIIKKMTWKQIHDVSAFVAAATKTHPYPARLIDAG